MKWKGKTLKTIEDLMRHGIDKCDTPEEAQQFIMDYVLENTHARANIGYLAGYYSNADKKRIFEWFDVVHPIFGTKDLDAAELMRMGMKMGENMGKKRRKTDEEDVADINVTDYIKANISIAGKLMGLAKERDNK